MLFVNMFSNYAFYYGCYECKLFEMFTCSYNVLQQNLKHEAIPKNVMLSEIFNRVLIVKTNQIEMLQYDVLNLIAVTA